MKPGDLVQTNCDNRKLTGRKGLIVLIDWEAVRDMASPVYGLCVLIDEKVYGFEPHEIEIIDDIEVVDEIG